ncbi:MAG: hypothetical protein LBO72_06925 [Helicobacteraceae bacterium]|nr:hypothetical protein [Helicobacteraceae bacterium]
MATEEKKLELNELTREIREIKLTLEKTHNLNVSPLPSGEDLERINTLVPGAAHFVIELVNRQAEHNMNMDKERLAFNHKVLDAQKIEMLENVKIKKRSQYFAISSIVIMLISAGVFAYNGMSNVAIASIIAAVAPIISAALANISQDKSQK